MKLVSGSRRITLDNTLDERLRLLEDRVSLIWISQLFRNSWIDVLYQMLPEIRKDLFGVNENRKFLS